VVRLDDEQAESKATHWRAVAVNACEQCGRARLPMLDTPAPLLNYLGGTASTPHRLVLDPGVEPSGMPTNLAGLVEIAIGPEGGFAEDELEAFGLAGFIGVRLGPRILRTETAAIAALTWLQTRYGDMQALVQDPV
jgi:16S rRNA (uracil1498-N3)-methyltransferase